MYLAGGAVLNDVTMLDKDDTVYFAWRGEAWREPGSEASAAQEPAAGAGDASAEEASQSKPASFRPRSPAEELHVRRSGDAHRQRDAARAHSRLRDGASLARGVPAGLGRRPAHPARPARHLVATPTLKKARHGRISGQSSARTSSPIPTPTPMKPPTPHHRAAASQRPSLPMWSSTRSVAPSGR